MGSLLKSLVLGFVAGVIAYLLVHEGVSLWLLNNGYATRVPWSMEPSLITGSPQIIADAAWGGLWGAIFGLILGSVPKGSMTVRGAILGLVGTAVVGTLVALPLVHGQHPFATVDVTTLWPVLVLGAVFGAATAWLYGFFTSGCRLP